MTNVAGIAPIEQTKALTHIMHYPIQMNFNAQTPAQFERIKISSKTSQAMQLDVQGCTVFPRHGTFRVTSKEW